MGDAPKPRHYEASESVAGGGPLRAFANVQAGPVGLAYWRTGAVELVEHCNDVHPTLIFHAAAFHTLTFRHEDAVVGVLVLAGCGLLIEIATARATARLFPWYRKSSG